MFSLFKKKQAQSEPPLKKKIKDMKCRKINYVDEGFDTLASENLPTRKLFSGSSL